MMALTEFLEKEKQLMESATPDKAWLKQAKEFSETSVDTGMDEKTAYIYGFLHGARIAEDEVRTSHAKALEIIEVMRTALVEYDSYTSDAVASRAFARAEKIINGKA